MYTDKTIETKRITGPHRVTEKQRSTPSLQSIDNCPENINQGQLQVSSQVNPTSTVDAQLMVNLASTASHEEIFHNNGNKTGLLDSCKSGVEHLSGMSVDDVHAHRNSARHASLQTRVYTQGFSIQETPGQDRHVAHKAWHVVHQK